MELLSCLEKLSNAAGVGGISEAADIAAEMLAAYCGTVERDALGNVVGRVDCGRENAPLLMLEAHIDEVGLIVTGIDEAGFVRAAACGGADRRALNAAEVVVYGDKPYAGVFCSTPPHLSKSEKAGSLFDIPELGIDVGMDAGRAKQGIYPGDRIGFRPNFQVMSDTRVSGKSLDDRAGIAAILYCLDLLQKEAASGNTLPCDIAAVFAVQEELGCRGSAVTAFRVSPDAAIAVDVSFALTPDADRTKCGLLGKGPMIGWSPSLDDGMTRQLASLAGEKGIPYQNEVMGNATGTDADSIADAKAGIPTALLSIPLRYMHTPFELIDIRDVEMTGRLMAEYAKKGGIQQ